MDFLDDPFSEPKVTKAPIAGRFQPKAKPRPKKVPAAAVKATKELPVKSVQQDLGLSKSVQPNIIEEKKSNVPSKAPTTDNEFLENSLEDGNLSAKEKEVESSADIERSEISVSGPLIMTVETAEMPTPDASSIQRKEEQPVFPNVSFASASPIRPCNSQIAPDQSIDKILQDSVCFEEPIVSDDGDFQIDVEQLGAGDFSCLDSIGMMSESAVASGSAKCKLVVLELILLTFFSLPFCHTHIIDGILVVEKRAVKLLPKPKAQGDRQNSAEAGSHLSHAVEPPSENQHVTLNGSVHIGEPDTTSDAFDIRLDDSFSLDASMYQPDTVVLDNTDSLMPEDLPQQISEENHGERRSYDAFDSSVKSVAEGFLSRSEGNDIGHDLDGINDGFYENSSSYDKGLNESASNRVDNNEGDNLGEEIMQKKKPRKSKKEPAAKDKPTRKRKTAAQKPDESTQKPPKKFPHATRRKRCVDKSLLEAPEDELDLQRVPIKDLIVLAEYRERQAKKDAATAPPSATSERIDNMAEDLPYVDNETDQYGDASDIPSTSAVQTDTGYFNYQTYMNKGTRARWTKQDTELFYQGISQFGSDLSMVQQLFPGRTRHQIKLKYKKEERQNPMRLHDALTGRAQDLSHFELVIERLQEQAARDAKTEKDDSVCPTGEDQVPEEVCSTHEDVAESKKEEGQAADAEPDKKTQNDSPPKSYLSEEDDFDWSEYRSEL
ncbi:Transcription factor TFIIIB component B'' [Bienertia sinuspersici]